jgi:hypothetical protein
MNETRRALGLERGFSRVNPEAWPGQQGLRLCPFLVRMPALLRRKPAARRVFAPTTPRAARPTYRFIACHHLGRGRLEEEGWAEKRRACDSNCPPVGRCHSFLPASLPGDHRGEWPRRAGCLVAAALVSDGATPEDTAGWTARLLLIGFGAGVCTQRDSLARGGATTHTARRGGPPSARRPRRIAHGIARRRALHIAFTAATSLWP